MPEHPTPRATQAARFGPVVVIALAVVGYPIVAPGAYGLSIGVNIAFFAMAAIGLTLAVGGAGQMALGQGGFMAIGAYGVAYLTTETGLPFPVALLAGVALAVVAGVLVGYIALRLAGNYLAMATLAAGSIVYTVLLFSQTFGGSQGYFGIPLPSIGSYEIDAPVGQYALMWGAVALCYAGGSWLKRSHIGRELRAIRDDEVAARCVGIDITGRKVQIFAVSALIGGLAGGLDAPIQGAIDPALFSPAVSFQLFVVVVLGGTGSIAGAIVAASVVQYSTQVISGSGNYALVLLGVVAIVVMAVLPRGFAGIGQLPVLARLRRPARSGRAPAAEREQPPVLESEHTR